MCEFMEKMKLVRVRRPRVGWKLTAGKSTGYMESYATRRKKGWMQCSGIPDLLNEIGWYIHLKNPRRCCRRHMHRRVMYKGNCVYGNNFGDKGPTGVRAEWVKFL